MGLSVERKEDVSIVSCDIGLDVSKHTTFGIGGFAGKIGGHKNSLFLSTHSAFCSFDILSQLLAARLKFQ